MSRDGVREEGRRSVLVVEDEGKLREMLVRAIREMGFEVRGVPSGEDGLGTLIQSECDIALVDLNLPGMHGLDFCDQVRRRWPETQLLILTGYGDLEAAKKAIRLDVVDFLTKPCALGDLESALDRAVRRRRHHIITRLAGDEEEVAAAGPAPAARAGGARARTIEEVEREHILAALDRNHGNRRATARQLGLSVRTLYYRLSVYERQGYIRR